MAREGWQNTENFQKNKTLCNTKIQQFILKDAGLSVHQAKAAVTEAEQCIKVVTVSVTEAEQCIKVATVSVTEAE